MNLGDKIELLSFPDSVEDALRIQEKWRNKFYLEINESQNISPNDVKVIAGVDISYSVKKPNLGICCIVIWDFKSKCQIEHKILEGKIEFPYVSGLLAFREGNLIARTFELLSRKPDLIMFDGHGYCHPKRFGEAIHIGYALDIPSIGIGKSFLIGKINKEDPIRLKNGSYKKGFKVDIFEESELVGYACYRYNSIKPIIVSSGYRTDLETAYKITTETTLKNRLPEPLYLADRYSRQKIQNIDRN